MKKIISIILSLIILCSQGIVFADVVDDLKAVKVLPENVIYNSSSSDLISRGEFAQMIARILTGRDMEKTTTNFSDVDETNEFSGYISYLAGCGIINGTDGGMFLPASYIELGAANKMIVTVLGYKELAEKKGGYPDGYNSIAADLMLYSDVQTSGGYLTKYNAAMLVHNALFAEMFDSVNYAKGNTLLCKYLKISAYTGEIVDSDVNTRFAKFRVEKNKFEDNPQMLPEGSVQNFTAIRTINVSDYERVPVTVWVDENEVIVNIIPKNNVNIMYGYVSKINGDVNKESFYSASNLEKLMFINDEEEYDFSDSVLVKYNNEYKTSSVKLCGRFVKAVFVNDEITFVESWDISHGGLITSKGENEIFYISGEKSNCKIENIYDKKSLKIYINNKSADFADLRDNVVFDYYETDDELVIIATEKSYTEYLNRYSQNSSVVVGETEYLIDDNFYISKDGLNYKTGIELPDLLGKFVKLYIAPNGYAKYITLAQETLSDEFYGIVTGINSDVFNESAEVKMFKLVGTNSEEVIYKINDKTKYIDLAGGLDDIKNSLSDVINGSSIFIFKTNDEDEIVSVESPKAFYGTKLEGSDSIAFSVSGGTITATFGTDLVYFKSSQPLVAFYEADGEFYVKNMEAGDLYRLTGGTGAKLKLFGKEKTEIPDLSLLCGENLDKYYNAGNPIGLYIGKNEALNEAGEVCSEIHVINYNGTQKYLVSNEIANKIETDTGGAGLIQYATTAHFSNETITYVSAITKFASRYDNWLAENSTALQLGTVEKIVGNRVYFEDGSVYYVNPTASSTLYIQVNENAPVNRFKAINKDDIKSGDVVFYRVSSKYISGMFVVE